MIGVKGDIERLSLRVMVTLLCLFVYVLWVPVRGESVVYKWEGAKEGRTLVTSGAAARCGCIGTLITVNMNQKPNELKYLSSCDGIPSMQINGLVFDDLI